MLSLLKSLFFPMSLSEGSHGDGEWPQGCGAGKVVLTARGNCIKVAELEKVMLQSEDTTR